TVTDILRELEKPGRDPRPAFKTASFREGVENLEDLKPGMVLEGVVTNVAAFGAFVVVGVHQDGLVHISAMANTYVKDPRKVAKPGDVVRVKVLEVDPKRRRISLTMRLDEAPATRSMPARAETGPRPPATPPSPSRLSRAPPSRRVSFEHRARPYRRPWSLATCSRWCTCPGIGPSPPICHISHSSTGSCRRKSAGQNLPVFAP